MDDSVESRRALRELLEAQGITIVGEAADGARGIEFAQKLMPDVVLMDVKMPGIGGIEPGFITSSLPDTHVIVLNAFDDESLRRRAHEVGATRLPRQGKLPATHLRCHLPGVGFMGSDDRYRSRLSILQLFPNMRRPALPSLA